MKFFIYILFFISLNLYSNDGFKFIKSKFGATKIVYITERRYEADLIVYITNRRWEANFENGIWYIEENFPKNKVYITNRKSEADLIIYITNRKYEAGKK